ncbi:toxin-antitoxin system, toxin component, Bro domain protein [Flavobacterium branchiophilum NBRC 15030 = ATCC 35035]|uniref:Phage anti-repressor protein n=1 Tax=Flavobacterium branchiophilum TaxID=55197 RepID=A0A543G153_9FLAO|nr:antA/AntB antirepressor family protein [Flavobacterium branchiophilum]OXA76365.1 toxin-antitoxin system, toxin component, Bro domain protein [Flavobacterium branchiophilum NBRC 15030 = ATCC 35035]TQM39816.1 phage anti-repressor protein [Flavobacterium branchiophilum]GEM55277.1 hypothetical protein FB1_14980 [Flavobacterium branchiophilum NBRC 15030 = ATCC 35035]
MNQLITISENNGQKAVSARELHSFLEVGRDFSNWIKNRIQEYGFIENEDFEVFANSGEKEKSGRPAIEYALTLDMAKELAMVEKNTKGKQARRYFIAIEKQATAPKVETIKLSKFDQKRKLIELIRENLKKGDVKKVAHELDVNYNTLKNVMRYNNFSPKLVQALYNKALANKQTALPINEMINQLTLDL